MSRAENQMPTNAEKMRARKLLNRAVAAGRVASLPCEKCGAVKAQGHHDDYTKPLQVRWWCPRCHSQHHNQKHPVSKNCVICGKAFTPHPTKRERAKTCPASCHARREHAMHQRLTLEQMADIQQRYAAGRVTQQQLADEYGCDRTRISQIVRGKSSRIPEINDSLRAIAARAGESFQFSASPIWVRPIVTVPAVRGGESV